MNTHISDLFFNRDLEGAKLYQGGVFIGFDELLLKLEAEAFLSDIKDLGVDVASITPADIIRDFLNRL